MNYKFGCVLGIAVSLVLGGCFSSPTQSFLVVGYMKKSISVTPPVGAVGKGVPTDKGYGNGSLAFVEQAMVNYKSPMSATSNNVSPTLEIPLK